MRSLSFSRGFSHGFLDGNDHKRLVRGDYAKKRGLFLGRVTKVTASGVCIDLAAPVKPGDGLVLDGTGNERRDWIHASDVARLLALVAEKLPSPEPLDFEEDDSVYADPERAALLKEQQGKVLDAVLEREATRTTGIGNGSVFHVVPNVFLKLHARAAEGKGKAAQDRARAEGEIEASVALGFTAGIAALGLFFIPAVIAISINATGIAVFALTVFVVFYVSCLLATWWWYRRNGAEVQCD